MIGYCVEGSQSVASNLIICIWLIILFILLIECSVPFRFTAHSSLDDHLARWFGLNQSKYQWALDDYYESKGMVRN